VTPTNKRTILPAGDSPTVHSPVESASAALRSALAENSGVVHGGAIVRGELYAGYSLAHRNQEEPRYMPSINVGRNKAAPAGAVNSKKQRTPGAQ
jgi:hypothetical protein